MQKNSSRATKENMTKDDLEGYCIDLIAKLAEKLKIKYTIRHVGDGEFGRKKPTETGFEWTGMVKEILDDVLFHSD